jgi:tRNA(adenine34) deaminase
MYQGDYMSLALSMANLAFEEGEVPVGAIVVHEGRVIGRGYNKVISNNSVSSHAEILAINNASQAIQNYRLKNCAIYVTLEPCHMCAKAIVDARLDFLYFGAKEPKTGAVQSIDHFLERDDLNHNVKFSSGHMAEESADLLRNFFQLKRKSEKLFSDNAL